MQTPRDLKAKSAIIKAQSNTPQYPITATSSSSHSQSQSVDQGHQQVPATDLKTGPDEYSRVPKYRPFRLFWMFLTEFGVLAWGGPAAQIMIFKDELVTKQGWIIHTRFDKIFSVLQILPGPQATQLCMFFGCHSGGRVGGIAAGIGFMLPGFLWMLLASYLYTVVGFGNRYVNASFRALQPMVAAMVCPCHLR